MNSAELQQYLEGTHNESTSLCNENDVFNILQKAQGEGWIKNPLLDAGCGSDPRVMRKNCEWLKVEHHGIDINGGNGVFKADIHCLPYEDYVFGTVFCSNALEHVVSPVMVLWEFHRVLKNDGILILGLPRGKGHDISPDHLINLTHDQVLNLFNHLGFELLHSEVKGPMEFFIGGKK